MWYNSVWGQRPEKLSCNVQEQEDVVLDLDRIFSSANFFSFWEIHGLMKLAYTDEGGYSVLSILIAMLVFSENALSDTPEIVFYQQARWFLDQVDIVDNDKGKVTSVQSNREAQDKMNSVQNKGI